MTIRRERRRRRLAVAVAVALVLLLAGSAILGLDLLEPLVGPPAGPSQTPVPKPIPTPIPTSALSPSLVPTTTSTGPVQTVTGTSARGAPAAPLASAPVAPAPTSQAGFRVRATVVPMGFPLPARAHYSYGDGWRAPRVGVANAYNQIRRVTAAGTYLRAHDGLDLEVPTGTIVLAPFDGVVIDPRPLWRPWDPARYGRTIVIRSDEPTSPGYLVILAHLSRGSVSVGDRVRRGQVVGRTGRSGNAAGTVAHLHVELRAPFAIRYGYAGVIRRLDAFDAEPSLRAADPHAG